MGSCFVFGGYLEVGRSLDGGRRFSLFGAWTKNSWVEGWV